jgi:hypothetical protein
MICHYPFARMPLVQRSGLKSSSRLCKTWPMTMDSGIQLSHEGWRDTADESSWQIHSFMRLPGSLPCRLRRKIKTIGQKITKWLHFLYSITTNPIYISSGLVSAILCTDIQVSRTACTNHSLLSAKSISPSSLNSLCPSALAKG